jgi:hypothetical protein
MERKLMSNDFTTPMRFTDLELLEVQVFIGANNTEYVLTEASGQAFLDYQSDQASSIIFEDGEAAGLQGTSQADINLLSKCLFRVKREEGKPDQRIAIVMRDFLNTVKKGSIIRDLCERVKEMSGIVSDKDSPEALKKQIDKLEKKLAKAEKKEKDQKK